MSPRLWVRTRRYGGHYVVKLVGMLDGSTAHQVLETLLHVPRDGREIVVDLSGLTAAEPFGLDVLERGLTRAVQQGRVRIRAAVDQPCLDARVPDLPKVPQSAAR